MLMYKVRKCHYKNFKLYVIDTIYDMYYRNVKKSIAINYYLNIKKQ